MGGTIARRLVATGILVFGGTGGLVHAAEPSMQARVQRLEDVEAIRVLLDRYVDANESRDYEAYSRLFARDGELVMGGDTRLKGPAAIRDYLQKSFGGAANASKGPQKGSSHVLTNIRIEVNGDAATSECRWMLVIPGTDGGKPQIGSKGRYLDKLVREEGTWKFKERAIRSEP